MHEKKERQEEVRPTESEIGPAGSGSIQGRCIRETCVHPNPNACIGTQLMNSLNVIVPSPDFTINRTVVMRYGIRLESRHLVPGTIVAVGHF